MVVNNWIAANLIWITLAIAIIVLIYFVFTIIQATRKKRRFVSQLNIILLILGLMFLIFLTYRASEIEGADWGQIILLIGLVAVTAAYASSAEKQADANREMAEEMRQQRIMASRPIIIQKAVVETETIFRAHGSKAWFSYFEVYNAGNGTAIEVEISLMNSDKTTIHSQRKSFLRAGESPITFEPKELSSFEESTFYLASEYKSILSATQQPTWYQTWLPFKTTKASEKGRIYVIPGELNFLEVSEKERIDAFSSRSKPK